MNNKLVIDDVDKKILYQLLRDARTSYKKIAKECGMSGAAIHQRIKKLEKSGVILGSYYDINPAKVGNTVCAFIGISLTQGPKYKSVEEKLAKIPEVVESHFTTGEYSFIVKILCKSNEDLKHILINTIHDIPGIERTTTFVSLEQIINKPMHV